MTRLLVLIATVALGLAATAGSATGPTGQIAFMSGCDISVMDANGTNVQQLTHTCLDSDPSWSPDGSQIAFTSTRDSQQPGIFVMNADGTGARPVTPIGLPAVEPSWSAQGVIAFADVAGLDGGIDTINPDGSGLSYLTDYGFHPSWSPFGGTLVFGAPNPDAGNAEWVYEMTSVGNDVQPLAPGDEPAYSPDGRLLAWEAPASIPGTMALVVADSDGSNQRTVVDDVEPSGNYYASGLEPAWSPDSQWLAYVAEPNSDIWVVPEAGGTPVRLTVTAENDASPDWRPAIPSTGLVIASVRFGTHACARRPGNAIVYVLDAQKRALGGATVRIGAAHALTDGAGKAVVKVTPAKRRHQRIGMTITARLAGRPTATKRVSLPSCG